MIFQKIKFLARILLLILAGLILIGIFINLNVPDYIFPEPTPFHGSKIYNPYQDMDSSRWLKANFQVQSRVWWGLTNGRNNQSKSVFDLYYQLGYDILCFSDYQHINKYEKNNPGYIPAYEHGFGIRKRHQVCIGSNKVLWLDYPFWQSLSHKQNILNRLRPDNGIVAIAHPNLKNGYEPSDFKYLTGFDLIEVFNHITCSETHWDSALSAGKPAFILADDDAHDISNPHLVGRFCTFIKANSTKQNDVVQALKTGKAYGAQIYMIEEDGYPEKIAYSRQMPFLKSAQMDGNSFTVEVSQTPKQISFIGQGGKVKRTVYRGKAATYEFGPDDTYIRTEILFPNKWDGPGTRFLLNPVFRYSGEGLPQMPVAVIDKSGTLINRIIAYATLVFFLVNIFVFRHRLFGFGRRRIL
jgi:hypothetical protein